MQHELIPLLCSLPNATLKLWGRALYYTHQEPRALVMPYMVVGCMTVMLGVATLGVVGPNTAIVEGAYTLRLCCAASSSTFCHQ